MDIRIKAVLFYIENIKPTAEICSMYGISARTLRRWASSHESNGVRGLQPKKTGPKRAKNSIPESLEQKILKLKQKHPSWGARRIKYQYDLPTSWRTVHRIADSKIPVADHGLVHLVFRLKWTAAVLYDTW